MLNLIDHLPRNSAYLEALADDEEVAARLAKEPESESVSSEKWSDWTPERHALAHIQDLLSQLIRVSIMAAGGKPGPFKPTARPIPAVSRIRENLRLETHRQLVSRFAPSQTTSIFDSPPDDVKSEDNG